MMNFDEMTTAEEGPPKFGRSEGQDPKLEIRIPKEIRSSKSEMLPARLKIQRSVLGLLSEFGFRVSEFSGVWCLVLGIY